MLVSQQLVALQRLTMPLVLLGRTQTTLKLIGFCHRKMNSPSCGQTGRVLVIGGQATMRVLLNMTTPRACTCGVITA